MPRLGLGVEEEGRVVLAVVTHDAHQLQGLRTLAVGDGVEEL